MKTDLDDAISARVLMDLNEDERYDIEYSFPDGGGGIGRNILGRDIEHLIEGEGATLTGIRKA